MYPNAQTQAGHLPALGAKNDPASQTPVGPYNHGQTGLFSAVGQDPRVFSAMTLPMAGLLARLPIINDGSDTDSGPYGGVVQEFHTLLTGVTQGAQETWANQPTTDCADGARAGLMKLGTIIVPSGRSRHSPNAPVSIVRSGLRRDIADPLTLTLMNGGQIDQLFGVPATTRSATNTLLNEFAQRNYAMAVGMSRLYSQLLYTGSPANNNGEARQFMGLDLWINTGNKRDAFTSAVLTAANSEIYNFDYSFVAQNVRDIQRFAETMIGALDWKVTRQGLGAAWDGDIAMRPQLWDEITKVITVRQYQEALAQANLFTSAQAIIDMRDELNFRNSLRANPMWPLRGRLVPVVLDDGIFEQNVTTTGRLFAAQYASDIYFVPRRVLGQEVTYFKYFDHANENALAFERLPGSATMTSDGGMFRWYFNAKNGCFDWTVDFMPKLIMRTPQIAGRITNVAYQLDTHWVDSNPASAYFADGGRTTSPTSTFYNMWAATPSTVAPTS